MELRNVDRLAPLSGYVLNPEELAGLEMAMLSTKLLENLNNNLDFWGKIFGKTQDYLIVQYVNNFAEFPAKKFYFCTSSDYTLRAVPPITEDYALKAKTLLSQFEGDPSFFKYTEADEEEEPEEVPNEDEEEAEKPKLDTKFREIHRLSYVIKVEGPI